MASKICPGFQIVRHTEWETDSGYTSYYPDDDFDKETGQPFTKVCTHDKCQYDAEYKYALIKAVSSGVIDNTDYARVIPQMQGHNSIDPFSLGIPKYCKNLKTGCHGYVIYKNDTLQSEMTNDSSVKKYVSGGIDYNPYTGDPYTKPCTHAEGECDPTVYIRWILIRLIAKGLLSEDILQKIEEDGWIRRIRDGRANGEDPLMMILEEDVACPPYVWLPREADDWTTFRHCYNFVKSQK
jgi:hypothetical protein